jgi:molecular chaperone HscB
MIDFSRNHFELFGLPELFRFDAVKLDAAYRRLQSEVHPDRFATASDTERRSALQSSARVNEAYRALKDPVLRAQYLLSLRGVEAFADTDTSLPFEFLEQQLERRESAEQAFDEKDGASIEGVLTDVRADYRALEAQLATTIDSEGEGALEQARLCVRELQFLSKLAADLDTLLGELEG